MLRAPGVVSATARRSLALESPSHLKNSICRMVDGVRRFSHNADNNNGQNTLRSTTVLYVRKDGKAVMIGDGQVSIGSVVHKETAVKVRKLGETCVAGFAGGAADALTLFDKMAGKLEDYPTQLPRACVELAKDWRTDKVLRHLNAVMLITNNKECLNITGSGDVSMVDSVAAIGSGGHFAEAAARALVDIPGLTASDIAVKAMKIASSMCVYTNSNFTMMSVDEASGAIETLISGDPASAHITNMPGRAVSPSSSSS
eukprot:gnl/Spiro4/5912_TR3023_c0_g1_i1.p1 gnl/Spiro4/5912_TR3023_c0_g1~~gnl/Spiro4/5912_TR3023_c0_g1_i1.p1  ORF type:complete len:272 (+),score=59.05 gnl/Spiro4/5912_TR3023_c0_g1_i1:45-818(+)